MDYRPLKFFAIAASSLAATLAICFAIMAWSEPGDVPPGGNIAAPINTGSTLQNKIGDLLVGAGLKISSLGTAFALKTNDAQETPRLVVGQDGNVGIGTTGPGKKLEVAGDTKSTQFCLGDQCCSTWDECKAFAGGTGGRWVQRASGTFLAVASSSDGAKLAAITKDGNIYTSADSGATWNYKSVLPGFSSSFANNYYSMSSSENGMKLAVAVDGNYIYTSADSGATWTKQVAGGSHAWTSITSSSDGGTLVAGSEGYAGVYVSRDSGNTWIGTMTTKGILDVASSADGTKLAVIAGVDKSYVGGGSGNFIYISQDGGKNWNMSNISSKVTCFGCSCSGYGCPAICDQCSSKTFTSLTVARGNDKLYAMDIAGALYASNDFGQNWTLVNTYGPNGYSGSGGSDSLYLEASSLDGAKLVIRESSYHPQVYTSTDSGNSLWIEGLPIGTNMADIASSADGTKLVAVTGTAIWSNH